MRRTPRSPEPARCPTCSARILDDHAACPICGAKGDAGQVAATPWRQLPHVLLSLAILLAAGVGFPVVHSARLRPVHHAHGDADPHPLAHRDLYRYPITNHHLHARPCPPRPHPFAWSTSCSPTRTLPSSRTGTASPPKTVREKQPPRPRCAVASGQKLCLRISPDLNADP